jgi:hypothetical protein
MTREMFVRIATHRPAPESKAGASVACAGRYGGTQAPARRL